jgi:dihydrodipicolinate synthase/N-acetylneuraminate lyase
MTREQLKGIVAFLPTVFTDNGEIDEPANRENVRRLVDAGMHVVQATGGAAEFYSLTLDEQDRLMAIVAEECGAKARTMCGCGTVMGTADAIERCRIAADRGIGSAILVTPHYFELQPKEVIRFFEDIAGAVPNIGLIHFNTQRAKTTLGPDEFRELAAIPTFLGGKQPADSIYDFFALQDSTPEIVHFCTDDLWVPAMMNGCRAVDSILAATRPQMALRMWELCEAGQWPEAMALQRAAWRLSLNTNRLPEAEARFGDCSIDKGVVLAGGFLITGDPRPPYFPVDEKVMAIWRNRFADLDAGEYDG